MPKPKNILPVVTAEAADKTAQDMVAKSKRGEGALSFTPKKKLGGGQFRLPKSGGMKAMKMKG